MLHHQDDGRVLNSSERFLEVQLQNDSFTARLMALMYVLEWPSQAVLDRARSNKAVLILTYEFENYQLKLVSKDFGQDFEAAIQQGDRPEIVHCLRVADLRDKGYVGGIYAFQAQRATVEFSTKIVETAFDDVPALF